MNLGQCISDPISCTVSLGGSAVGSVISAGANSIIGAWAADFQHAEATMLSSLLGAWMNLQTPNVSDSSTSAISFLARNTAYLTGICGIIGLIIAGVRMMWLQRAEPAREALAGLLRLIIVQGAAVTGIGYLTQAGDKLATAIMADAVSHAGTTPDKLGVISLSTIGSATLVIVLSLIAMIAFFIQLVLLIVRDGLLILVAGTLPLSAAASMTPIGSSWFRKNVGWLLAFILFKPIAALVYGAAILSATNSTDVIGTISGIVLVALASLTLPALMRLVAPMVSAVGDISGAQGLAFAASAASGAIAVVASGGAALPGVASDLGHRSSAMGNQALGNGSSGGDLASGSSQPSQSQSQGPGGASSSESPAQSPPPGGPPSGPKPGGGTAGGGAAMPAPEIPVVPIDV